MTKGPLFYYKVSLDESDDLYFSIPPEDDAEIGSKYIMVGIKISINSR
jgi:hypothetical protein